MDTSFQHHFLIAMPSLHDSFFNRTVIYICEHDEKGAMGLVVNQPGSLMLPELLEYFEIKVLESDMKTQAVFAGGPLEKGQGMVIHDGESEWKASLKLSEGLTLTTSIDILNTIGKGDGPENTLITLGYSGWDAGQLEQEIAENSWLTVFADKTVLFDVPVEERWHAAAKLLGINMDLMTSAAGHA